MRQVPGVVGQAEGFRGLDQQVGRLDVVPERVMSRDRSPVARQVEVQGTGLDGDAVAHELVGLAQPFPHDGAIVDPGELGQGFQQVDMRIHRLEAVIDAQAIGSPGDGARLSMRGSAFRRGAIASK